MMEKSKDFNEDIIKQTREIMKSNYRQLIEGYIEDSKLYFERIHEGFMTDSYDQIGQSAHPLKSSSAGVGMAQTAEIAAKIEFIAKQQKITPQEKTKIEQLLIPLRESITKSKIRLRKELEK